MCVYIYICFFVLFFYFFFSPPFIFYFSSSLRFSFSFLFISFFVLFSTLVFFFFYFISFSLSSIPSLFLFLFFSWLFPLLFSFIFPYFPLFFVLFFLLFSFQGCELDHFILPMRLDLATRAPVDPGYMRLEVTGYFTIFSIVSSWQTCLHLLAYNFIVQFRPAFHSRRGICDDNRNRGRFDGIDGICLREEHVKQLCIASWFVFCGSVGLYSINIQVWRCVVCLGPVTIHEKKRISLFMKKKKWSTYRA